MYTKNIFLFNILMSVFFIVKFVMEIINYNLVKKYDREEVEKIKKF